MKKITVIFSAICAMLISFTIGAAAQSTNELASKTSVDYVFNVTRMSVEGQPVNVPEGYYLSIKDGRLTTYLPIFASEEFQMLESDAALGIVLKNEPVDITATERKGVHTLSFSVHRGPVICNFRLSYSESNSAKLNIRGYNYDSEYTGDIKIQAKRK